MNKIVLLLSLVICLSLSQTSDLMAKESTKLHWNYVVEKTMATHPELLLLDEQAKEKTGDLLTAGLKPDPELELEAENILGNGGFKGTNLAEYHLAGTVTLESWKKRKNRRQVALVNQSLFQFEKMERRLTILYDLREDYLASLIVEKQLLLARDGLQLARLIYRDVRVRAEEGAVPRVEMEKAQAELQSQRARELRLKSEFENSLQRLAANWGGEATANLEIQGKLTLPKQLPELTLLEKKLEEIPAMKKLQGEEELRKAELALEKSRRREDPAVSMGMKWEKASHEHAFKMGVSLPLPVYNRNQGEITSAKARLAQHPHQVESARRNLRRELRLLYRAMKGAWVEARQLEKRVIPGIELAFKSAREGYLAGKYGYLEVLDAQQKLLEEQTRFVEELSACLEAKLAIERLTGDAIAVDSSWTQEGDKK